MKKLSTTITIILLVFAATGFADLFSNRATGEEFYGYALQKQIAGKARVYVLQEDEKFKAITIDPAEYDVTYDAKGRRNNVIVIPVKNQEILLSQRVSQFLGKTIIQASSKGPRYIILDIDLPGGYGDNMKIVCDDILSTTNCPIVAFISGGTFGGVFSSAAAIPLACDKVYIAPDAMIGTVSTPIGTVLTKEQIDEYYQTFSPDSLAAYTAYVANIAEQKKRPVAPEYIAPPPKRRGAPDRFRPCVPDSFSMGRREGWSSYRLIHSESSFLYRSPGSASGLL